MDTPSHPPELAIECATCPATGTTACGDCVVTHLLANDAGPIDYEPTAVGVEPAHVADASAPDGDRALALFATAGLLDDPPLFVAPDAFALNSAEPTTFRRAPARADR